jgi:hypothetical protein
MGWERLAVYTLTCDVIPVPRPPDAAWPARISFPPAGTGLRHAERDTPARRTGGQAHPPPGPAVRPALVVRRMACGPIDVGHRVKPSGRTVTVMYTGPRYPADLAGRALQRNHTAELAFPGP